MNRIVGTLLLIALASCDQSQPEQNSNYRILPAQGNQVHAPAPPSRSPPEPAFDPKSAQAAGQVVQHYAAVIEQARWGEAASYWGDAEAASSFAKELRSRGLKHLEIGKPGEPEGAAGSIYVTIPVVFYDGSKRDTADVTLRRVNDVPGSTEAQRRWHIERIDWKP